MKENKKYTVEDVKEKLKTGPGQVAGPGPAPGGCGLWPETRDDPGHRHRMRPGETAEERQGRRLRWNCTGIRAGPGTERSPPGKG